MEFTHSSNDYFDTIKITGSLNVSNIVKLTPKIKHLITNHIHKDLVVDMQETEVIDSSVIQLLINTSKRKKENSRRLFILKPAENVTRLLTETKVDNFLPIIQSAQNLIKEISDNRESIYSEFILQEGDLKRLTSCKCPVCGSEETSSYFVIENNYDWSWESDSPFPRVNFKGTKNPAKYFSSLPCICRECFFTSIDFSDFSYVKEGVIKIKSKMDSDTKASLSKSITKRQKIAKELFGQDIKEEIFNMPRARNNMTGIMKLAEESAKTGTVNGKDYTPFEVGFIDYLNLLFTEEESRKTELINSCRTWLSRTMEKRDELSIKEYSITLFILVIANINTEKISEAKEILSEFDSFTQKLDTNIKEIQGPQNPEFWHNQATYLWNNEIKKNAEKF